MYDKVSGFLYGKRRALEDDGSFPWASETKRVKRGEGL